MGGKRLQLRTGGNGPFSVRYPWVMAPTINTTKLVATAIATFVSTDKFIIFPSVTAESPATSSPSPFHISFLASASDFGAHMDATCRAGKR